MALFFLLDLLLGLEVWLGIITKTMFQKLQKMYWTDF